MEASLRKRFTGAALAMVLANGAAAAFRFVSAVLVANVLGDEDMGSMAVARTGIDTVAFLACLGLPLTATRWLSFAMHDSKPWVCNLLGRISRWMWTSGLVATALVVIAAPFFARHVQHSERLVEVYWLMAPAVLFAVDLNFQTATLAGLQAFRQLSFGSVFAGLVTAISLPLGARIGGLEGVAAAHLIATVIALIAHRAIVRTQLRRCSLHLGRGEVEGWGRIVRDTAVPSMVQTALATPVFWIVQNMVYTMPGGKQQNGYLAIAEQWRQPLLLVPTTLDQITVPFVTEQLGKGRVDRARKMLWATIAVIGAFCGVVAFLGWLFSDLLFAHLYKPEFAPAQPVLHTILFATCMLTMGSSALRFLMSTGRFWAAMVLSAAWAAVLLCGSYALGRSALGVAEAQIVANSVLFTAAVVWVLLVFRALENERRSATVA